MRDIARQKQSIWVCKATSSEAEVFDELTGEMLPCGEYVDVYANPVEYKMCVNPTVGWAKYDQPGLSQDTKRELTTTQQDLDIDIGDLVFVDIEPILDESGALSVDGDGNYYSHPDYTISYIYKSKRGNQTRYGITIRSEGQ